MEVMRPHFQRAIRKSGQPSGLHMNHIVLILKWTFDQKELAARHHKPVAFVEIRRDDDVGNAGLILHRNEDKALRCAWPLAER